MVWLNGTVGSGKSAVGQALAAVLPGAAYLDGDHLAGRSYPPRAAAWRAAHDALLRLVARSGRARFLVVAYPLRVPDYVRLRAACGRAGRRLVVVTLAPPLQVVLRGRGTRVLDAAERKRVREMRSEGYHRRRFTTLTLPNAVPPPSRCALRIARRLCWQ